MEHRNYDLTLEHLKKMSSILVTEIDRDTVSELSDIVIDASLSPEERIISLLRQTENPYVYRDGDVLVKVSFAKTGKTLQSCMEDYLTAEVLLNR